MMREIGVALRILGMVSLMLAAVAIEALVAVVLAAAAGMRWLANACRRLSYWGSGGAQ